MNTPQKNIQTAFNENSSAEDVARGKDLRGRVVVITGGHSGIGLEATRVLAAAGARVIVGARNLKKAEENLAGISGVVSLPLDLANPESIDSFAREVLQECDSFDTLINNAGIMAVPLSRDSRGIEMQFATNHLGHYQLTQRLFLSLSRGARVITLTSAGHRFSAVNFDDPNFENRPYDKWKAYGQSKTANSLFTVELDRRAQTAGVRAFAVHPGRIVETDLLRSLSDEELKQAGMIRNEKGEIAGPPGMGLKSVPQGAATTVWCAISESLEGKGGVYCADCQVSEIVPDDSQSANGVRGWAVDPGFAAKLWELSEALTGVKFLP